MTRYPLHPKVHSPLLVEWSHHLRKGEVLSNGPGHAHLIDVKVGVRRDDSTGREVHSLPHQVPTHPTFLALQTLLDRLEWPPAPLQSLRNVSHMTVT